MVQADGTPQATLYYYTRIMQQIVQPPATVWQVATSCYTHSVTSAILLQIVDAVAYLHGLSVMHRDIKPENCLLAKPAQHYAAKGKPVKVGWRRQLQQWASSSCWGSIPVLCVHWLCLKLFSPAADPHNEHC